jgi:hypothetical protein
MHNLSKSYSEKADKIISKYYYLWSEEGQEQLREGFILAIKNKHLQIKK